MRGFDSAHNHRLHAASVRETFLPISNARVADYCRRSAAVPSSLPGCRPVTGPGFSAMQGGMGRPHTEAAREEVMRSFVSATKLPYGSKQVREMFLSLIALSKRGKARMTVDDFRSFFKKYVDKNDALLDLVWMQLLADQPGQETISTVRLAHEIQNMFLFRVEHVGSGAGGYEPKRVMKEYSSNRSRRQLKDAWLHVRGGRVDILPPEFAKTETDRQDETQNEEKEIQNEADEREVAGEGDENITRTAEGSQNLQDEEMEGDRSRTNLATHSLSSRILKMSALEEQMSQLELQIAEAANSIKPGRFADIGLTVDTIIDGAVDVEQVWTASRLSLSHAHPPAMRKTKTPEPRVQEEVSGSFARTSSLRRSNNESRTLELIEEQSEVYEHDSFRRKSRFLGDGEHEFDDAALSPKQDMTAEILETLKMSNEMCERTIHDICTWSKEWLEEMLETFRSCVDEDGDLSGAVEAALKDVESWTEQVVNDEMTIVQTLFPNLEVRFQHIFLLYRNVLLTRTNAMALDMSKNIDAPALSSFLQSMLIYILRSPTVVDMIESTDNSTTVKKLEVAFIDTILTCMLGESRVEQQNAVSMISPYHSMEVTGPYRTNLYSQHKISQSKKQIQQHQQSPRSFADFYFVGGKKIFVYPPRKAASGIESRSDQNDRQIDDLKLELLVSNGFRAHDTRNAITFNAQGHLICFAGKLCVVHSGVDNLDAESSTPSLEEEGRKQKFYRGHDAAVTCLTVYKNDSSSSNMNGWLTASGQETAYSQRRDAYRMTRDGAKGTKKEEEMTRRCKHAYVCLWSSQTMEELGRIGYEEERFYGSILSLSFSPDGKRLACVTADARHTLTVWDWQRQEKLVEEAASQQEVLGVSYCSLPLPNNIEILATFGKRHVRVWKLRGLELSSMGRTEMMHRDDAKPRLAIWDVTKKPPSFNKPSNISMEQAASESYLKTLWASKRPGFMAGEGKSVLIPAQQTSNRWSGKSYAAHLPDAAAIADGDKSYRIMQANMVEDPGEKNVGWEANVLLQVIQSRPDFDPRATTKRDLRFQEKLIKCLPSQPSIHGRMAVFEMPGTEEGSSRQDAYQSIKQVAPLTLQEERAFAMLEEKGWKRPFLARQTENPRVTSSEKIALKGTLRGSQPGCKRIATPNHILCVGFCLPRQDYSDKSKQPETDIILLCGGSDGRVYRFQVTTDRKEPNLFDQKVSHVWSDGTEAPKINLLEVSSCHSGPVNAIFTFKDGTFFTGGQDAMLKLWNSNMKPFYSMEIDGCIAEWRLSNAVRHLDVFRYESTKQGIRLDRAIVAVGTDNSEIHRFPVEPTRFREMEKEWSPLDPFSVVWAWRDPIQDHFVGLSISYTRLLAAPSGVGGWKGSILTSLVAHPTKDGYAAMCTMRSDASAPSCLQIYNDFLDPLPHRVNFEEASFSVDYNPDGSLLAVGSRNGTVTFVSHSTATKLHTVEVSTHAIRQIRFGPCGRKLVAVSDDRKVHVLVYSGEGERENKFTDDSVLLAQKTRFVSSGEGHACKISGLDWSVDGLYLRSSGSFHELLYWVVDEDGIIVQIGKQGLRVSDLRNITWRSTTCLVGWEVQAVWNNDLQGKKYAGPEITSLASNHFTADFPHFLAFCDEEGTLGLLRYPATSNVHKQTYRGHAGPVAATAVGHGGNILITAGRHDCCILVWRLQVKEERTPTRSSTAQHVLDS